MDECQETLKVKGGEVRWGQVGLLGVSAMLIREEHGCRPKVQVLSPFTADRNISLKVKDVCPWSALIDSAAKVVLKLDLEQKCGLDFLTNQK